MRCFVAVDLDPKLRQKVEELQKELAGLDTKLVEPHNLHFTLKFLGELDEGFVNKVNTKLEAVASSYSPFTVDVQGIGVFPNENFIRVVWLGAQSAAVQNASFSLTNLQISVNESLAGLFKKEKPSSHLTIARVRSQNYRKAIIEFLEKYKNIEIGTMNVEEIKLKKSTVTSKGPVYEDIAVFKLVGL